MNRKIKSQGDLDGACFLYSLANAVGSLSGESLTPDQWSSSVASLPKPRSFLRQDVGTYAFDEDGTRLTQMARRFVALASDEAFDITLHSSDRRGIARLIDQDSVVIIGDKSHWFVVTEVSASKAFLACSDEYNQSGRSYEEGASPRFARPFNKTANLSDLRVFGRMAFRVAKA